MKPKEILKHVSHRPFAYPKREWKFYQEWNNAVFLHWEVEPKIIEELLPKGLQLDTINGKAWVSLVAFDMNNIKTRYLPKPPGISDFQEINIRTYVVRNGKPSVYFLSMEANNKLACKIIKQLSKFPYRFSEMKRYNGSYQSKNNSLKESFEIEYSLGSKRVVKEDTDIWLTERYAVFQDYKKSIIEYDVHHLEWPMQHINCTKLKVDYPRFSAFINNIPDKVQYSPGVQVVNWDKRKHK